jgi:hypothetical protein
MQLVALPPLFWLCWDWREFAGTGIDSGILILVGLLALGATLILTGSPLSLTVMSFMKEEPPNKAIPRKPLHHAHHSPLRSPKANLGL